MRLLINFKIKLHGMRAVIQRVRNASVEIDEAEKASISHGLLILLGISDDDTMDDIEWLSGKIVRMRIFGDNEGLMNLSVIDIKGDILVVSQFTLHASTRKGNRPSFIKAARPETAIPLYEKFIKQISTELGKPVQTGEFGAFMQIRLNNDGPVTILIDSKIRE